MYVKQMLILATSDWFLMMWLYEKICMLLCVVCSACLSTVCLLASVSLFSSSSFYCSMGLTVLLSSLPIFTFRVSRRQREMYSGHARLSECLCVCVSVRGRMPTLLHGPGCNLGSGRECE